jgi:ubiquitin carboxyl-terminal hydrolase 4/11/15
VTLEISARFATPESGFSAVSLVRHHREAPAAAERGGERSVGIDQCFRQFAAREVLNEQNLWFCPRCRRHVAAAKKMDIWSVPKCLIIHLKRSTTTRRIDTLVNFPDELDMGPYVLGPQGSGSTLRYRLYAVSNHYGALGGGHYTANALVIQQNQMQGTWYTFDDSSVRATNASNAHSTASYVLFYEGIEPRR